MILKTILVFAVLYLLVGFLALIYLRATESWESWLITGINNLLDPEIWLVLPVWPLGFIWELMWRGW